MVRLTMETPMPFSSCTLWVRTKPSSFRGSANRSVKRSMPLSGSQRDHRLPQYGEAARSSPGGASMGTSPRRGGQCTGRHWPR